jgi:hypothetical protein
MLCGGVELNGCSVLCRRIDHKAPQIGGRSSQKGREQAGGRADLRREHLGNPPQLSFLSTTTISHKSYKSRQLQYIKPNGAHKGTYTALLYLFWSENIVEWVHRRPGRRRDVAWLRVREGVRGCDVRSHAPQTRKRWQYGGSKQRTSASVPSPQSFLRMISILITRCMFSETYLFWIYSKPLVRRLVARHHGSNLPPSGPTRVLR